MDTEEIICLNEELYDSLGNIIYYYVNETNTVIDFIESDKIICTESVMINNVKVMVHYGVLNARAYFIYNDIHYYLDIELASQPEYVLELVENLLKPAKK